MQLLCFCLWVVEFHNLWASWCSVHMQKAYVIHWVRLDRYSSVEKAYNDGVKRLEVLLSKVQDIDPWVTVVLVLCMKILEVIKLVSNFLILLSIFSPRLSQGSVKLHTHHFGPALKKSTMTSEEYKNAVLQAKEHILSGDIFQVVLSQCFERRTFADPFEVYRALRVVNPSPYMTYLQVCIS